MKPIVIFLLICFAATVYSVKIKAEEDSDDVVAAEKPAARTEEEVIEDETKPVKKITAEEVAVPEEEKATKKSDGDALTAVVEKVPATEGVGEVLKPVNAIVDEDEDPAADLDQVVTPETTIIEDIFGDWGDLFGGNDEEPETKKSENK